VSVHLPEYARPPPLLLPRPRRVRAIIVSEFRRRLKALNIALLVLIFLVVDLPIVVDFYFAQLVGGFAPSVAPITLFFVPFQLGVWAFFVILLAASVGAAIIAGDLASRSITMYLARPISRGDYLAAKASAAGAWISLGVLLPGWVAVVVVLALGYVSLPVALVAAGGFFLIAVLGVGALTALTLLLSALSSKSSYAGAGIFGVLIGTQAVASVLAGISGRSSFLYVSPLEDLTAVAQALFGVPGGSLDPWNAAAILVGVAAVSGTLAYLRLERTEVISE
jgi:ABC-type transport system involved in multi-copper enzyme maturation permease subunit